MLTLLTTDRFLKDCVLELSVDSYELTFNTGSELTSSRIVLDPNSAYLLSRVHAGTDKSTPNGYHLIQSVEVGNGQYLPQRCCYRYPSLANIPIENHWELKNFEIRSVRSNDLRVTLEADYGCGLNPTTNQKFYLRAGETYGPEDLATIDR